MASEPSERSSGNTVAYVVLGIVFAVLLVLGVCAGVFYFVVQRMSQAMAGAMQQAFDMQAAMQTAQGFLQEVGGGEAEAAYGMTSQAFQKRTSQKDFAALLDKHSELKAAGNSAFTNVNVVNDKATFTAAISGTEGSVDWKLRLVKEDNRWVVDQFQRAGDNRTEADAARKVADDFLQEIGAGKYDAAFARMSEGYRTGHKAADLRALADANPGLKGFKSQTVKKGEADDETAMFTGSLSGPGGAVSCTIKLVKGDDDAWKVESITVP